MQRNELFLDEMKAIVDLMQFIEKTDDDADNGLSISGSLHVNAGETHLGTITWSDGWMFDRTTEAAKG